jgi:hypothetical protein
LTRYPKRAQSTDKFSDQRVCGRVVATENMGQRLARAYAELGQFADSWRCIAEGTTAIEKPTLQIDKLVTGDGCPLPATACPRDHSRDREAGAHTGADCNARTRARPSADALQGHREEESSVDEFDRDRTGHCRRHDTRGLLRQFDNRRQVAGFLGLATSPHDSGDVERSQGISRAGRGQVRGTIIQAAWLWLKHQPKSAITRWFVQRTAGQSGRIRQIMLVALPISGLMHHSKQRPIRSPRRQARTATEAW